MIYLLKHSLIGKREMERKVILHIKDTKYNKAVYIIGWLLGILTSGLYLFTMYPTVAFWDCGEFLSSSYLLQVGHQPGSPLYQLIGAIVSHLCFGNVKLIAPLINSISAIASGMSVMLLFWIFVYLFNKYSMMFVGNIVAAGIASLIFAFTDSFWTCSSEAEVYSLSFFFTTLSIFSILRWEQDPKEKHIIFICFILGLSFGVHPLTLLIIPAILFIIYFHYFTASFKGIILTFLISCGLVFVFMEALPVLLSLLSFNPILISILIILILGILIFISFWKKLPLLNSIMFCILFFFIGCSTYSIIIIRGSKNLPMNEYKISSCSDLKSYINRDTYQKAPIVYGPYYTAISNLNLENKDNTLVPVFDKKEMTVFPRMWNYTNSSYEDGYIGWVGAPEKTVVVDGDQRAKPSMKQNLEFFIRYQIGYMYFRYLLWNFSGKTNDAQGYGDITNGQWQTGYIYTDKLLGVNEANTKLIASNPANNKYFAIPLILCILGMFYHIFKDTKSFIFVATIFLMYSLAIVIFVNQAAYEPRERDYSYLPSFMAVSIWIGIGILGISQIIANLIRVKKPRYVLPIFLIVPIWMCAQNFNDHNHKGQYTAFNFAKSMLCSCDKDAILFVDGDNDTYPLWYCQNVEKIRQDVKVINRELLNDEDIISSLTKQSDKCKPIKLSIEPFDYTQGKMQVVEINPNFDTINLKDALKDLYNDKSSDKKLKQSIKTIQGNKFFIPNKKDTIYFNLDNGELNRSDIVMLDIITNNISSRPIYFSSYSNDNFLGLDNYMSLEGFAYKINNKPYNDTDEIITQKAGGINAEKMYENMMHNYSFINFDKKIYFNEIERNIIKEYIESASALSYKLLQKGEDEKALALMNNSINNIPYSIHYYPYSLADMAIVYSALGQEDEAETLMDKSISQFEYFINYYNNGTIRYQSQTRLEAQKAISYYLKLCILAEDWGLEDMRIRISNSFFGVIQPYLEITYRQKQMMKLNGDYYEDEIKKVDELITNIKNLASRYEEEIPEEK
jgi:hypothetical protein